MMDLLDKKSKTTHLGHPPAAALRVDAARGRVQPQLHEHAVRGGEEGEGQVAAQLTQLLLKHQMRDKNFPKKT